MMSKTQNKIKPIWLILGGIATIGIGYGIYYILKKDKEADGFTSSTTGTGFCKYSGFPLRVNSCGNDVKDLQRYLNSKILPPRSLLKVDGKFGAKTQQELKRLEGMTTVSESRFNHFKSQINPFTRSRI